MAIPPFQHFFRPFLALLARDGELHIRDVKARLEASSGLSPAELAQRVPSGLFTVAEHRMGWARTYLFKAGLTERVSRGKYRISESGRKMLDAHPSEISLKDLRAIPQFYEWISPSGDPQASDSPAAPSSSDADGGTESMDEAMASFEIALRKLVEEELGRRLKEMTPTRFEFLVEQLVVKLGYGSSDDEVRRALGGGHGDGGVDGVINEDRLGLGQIYLQAKRWENTVGRPELQKFVGAIHGRAQKGVFITSGDFSKDAREYARTLHNMKLRLIDGAELVSLMVDCGLGVAESRVYRQYRIDNDFFEEGE